MSKENGGVAYMKKELVTEEDVRNVVLSLTSDATIKVLHYQMKPVTKEMLGMLGSYKSLKVTLQEARTMETRTVRFFVKTVPHEAKEQSSFIRIGGYFTKETSFYRTIHPELTKNYKGEKWCPKCYLIRDDIIVMEDLRLEGYMMLGRFYNDYTALRSMLASLARFHASSILAEAQLNEDSERTITLKERHSNIFKETVFTDTTIGWFNGNVKSAAIIAEKLGRDPKKVASAFRHIHKLIEPSDIHRNVICHADLWTNNILCDESKPLRKCVYVDYQLFRYSPLALDVLQLLHVNSSRSFRRKAEKRLVEFYHLTLQETVKMTELSEIAHVPALHQVFDAMTDLRLYGALIACFYSILGPKIALECSKTDEGYRKFITGQVTDVVLAFMEKDKVYREDVEDAVLQLADLTDRL